MDITTSKKSYQAYQDQAAENLENYWDEVAQDFEWDKKWSSVLEGDFSNLDIKWFNGATLNITKNCLDRHLKEKADKPAIIWEPNDPQAPHKTYTYSQLHQKVCQTANMLKSLDVKKGDIVCFYMPMIPELLAGVLACARIGAVHSVVFGGFSAISLANRINDCQAKVLMTADGGYRGKKLIDLKSIANEALESCPSIKHSVVFKHAGNKTVEVDRDRDWKMLEEKSSIDCDAESMDAEDPLFILYTSGSTGKPKGLLHTTAGYMVNAAHTTKNVFKVDDESVYWCTADIGWITGHTYLTYGPLLNGLTTIMFEGVPTFPDAGRFWEVCDKHQVTHFYTAPTAIRALEACDIELVNKHKLDSLKVLGSVGEPINEEAWEWYHHNIGKGKCPIVDTWWQTETGGIMISPIPEITKLKPGYATYPLPGIHTAFMDEQGKEIQEIETQGNLCIKNPWPSMARTIYGDHERFKQTYFSAYPGYYFTGDGARRDADGSIRITGRVDDVINVSGHRIGTAEVEDAIDQHPDIIEAAVVGYSHDIKGQGIYAFVIPSKNLNRDTVEAEVRDLVVKHIGAIAKPDQLKIVTGLPKTRSGKIMRRILRKIAEGEKENFGDISTLLNPEVVEEILKNV